MESVNGNLKPYPIFLIGLENRHCVVVGGGKGAEYKVERLLACDATVTVISPQLTPRIETWAEEGRFTWLKRLYQSGDLRAAFLVIAERSSPDRDALIFKEAEAGNVLINVIDDVSHSNFIAGSVFRQGQLVIAASTSGAAPALSVRLRQRFRKDFGPEYAEFLDLMMALREPVFSSIPEFSERRKRWYQMVDSDILELLRAGEYAKAYDRIAEIFGAEILDHF